ncbi:hypothetical protein ACLB90_09650 [Stenotrophomonas sp. LGBM10]|uniref:hypothetical protein n=1 Tax=Stenotrophomonas sp. LGBM10 TaxID=3390038 RepID=UPI00398AC67D
MRIVLMMFLLWALAGCSSAPHATGSTVPVASVEAGATTAQRAECEAAGGEARPLGRLQHVHCVVPYADAGKACSAKADCNGQCLAREGAELVAGAAARGVCQRDISQNFGCRQRIDNGVAQGTICVD